MSTRIAMSDLSPRAAEAVRNVRRQAHGVEVTSRGQVVAHLVPVEGHSVRMPTEDGPIGLDPLLELGPGESLSEIIKRDRR